MNPTASNLLVGYGDWRLQVRKESMSHTWNRTLTNSCFKRKQVPDYQVSKRWSPSQIPIIMASLYKEFTVCHFSKHFLCIK
jgi:hypothetical protein